MTKRTVLSMIFGILGPFVCLILDPMVFRFDAANPTSGFSSAYLGAWQPFSYAAIAMSVALLGLQLAGGPKRPILRAAFGGALLASSIFALALGVALLPYSLLGLLAGVGILGLTPFLTAWVYGRSGLDAVATLQMGRRRWLLALMGALAFFGVAATFHAVAIRSYDEALHAIAFGAGESRTSALSTLRRWDYLFGHQRLTVAFQHSPSEDLRRAASEAYHFMTLRDLGEDLEIAND